MLLTPGFIPTNACSGGMNPSFAIPAEAIADVKQIRQSARHVNLNVNKKKPTFCQISSMEDTTKSNKRCKRVYIKGHVW